MTRKKLRRAVILLAVFPVVIDLHERETERLQLLRRKLGQLDGPFLALLGKIAAIAGHLRAELDLVPLSQGVGIKLLADPGIVENADGQGLQPGRLAGRNGQPPVVDLGTKLDLPLLDAGKDHAAAAVVAEPAGDHAPPRRRVGRSEEEIAAGVLFRVGQAGGAHRPQFAGRLVQLDQPRRRHDLGHVEFILAAVEALLADEDEGKAAIDLQGTKALGSVAHHDPLAGPEERIVYQPARGLGRRAVEPALVGEYLARRLLGQGKRPGRVVIGDGQAIVLDGQRARAGRRCPEQNDAKDQRAGVHGKSPYFFRVGESVARQPHKQVYYRESVGKAMFWPT